ncbi:hypothetical protein vseg_021488 [Gypsophila vaccaria]
MSRVTVVALSSLLFVGLVVAVTIGVLNYANTEDAKPSTSTKAVQEMCQPTDYKEACFKSLSRVNSDDPKELVKAAFESTMLEISEVASKSKVLKELEKDPKTAEAVKDCKELFQDAIDDLQRSFTEIGDFDFNKVDKMLENLKIWLSATITYQETCLDGFDNTTGDASQKVRKILETSMQMSSNGLAIVTEMSALLGTLDLSSFSRRRLLADDRQVVGHDRYYNVIPNWLRNRRLMSSADDHVEGHNGDNTLLEDDEPDRRRRRLLSSVDRVFGHDSDDIDDDLMPIWIDAKRRKLLEATNLADDLKGKANVVVAQDGSGKYKTIEAAMNEIPKYGNESFVIYIKEGVYNEYLVLYKWMTHVVFVGDGPTKTRITNNKNFVDGVKTFKTATLSVLGDFFMAKDIGIENSAGAIKHQAVALRVQSDQSIFYNCHMDGYQDTLYTHTYRQFYRDCRVTGTIDFIFGDAAAFFQNCVFVVRKPLDNQRCIVTAQGRMERHQPTGIIIHRCRFEADPEYYPLRKKNMAFLGRPWKEYSKTIIMESYIDDSIAPEGWLPWEGTFALETCYYGEYNNEGPGSDMAQRVTWRGIKHIAHTRAERLMPPQLYGNDDWIRASGVPYDPTLYAFAPGPDSDPNAPEGAPYFISTNPYGSSFGSSTSSSSSGHSTSSSYSGSSSSGSASSSSGHSTPSSYRDSSSGTGSSSSSSASQGNNNDGSKSTTTGNKSSSSSTTTTPYTSEGGSTKGSTSSSSATSSSIGEGGSTGSSSTTSTPSTTEGGSSGSSSSSSSTSTTSRPSTLEGGSTGSSSTSTTSTPSTVEGGSTAPSPIFMEPLIPSYTPPSTTATQESTSPTTTMMISQSPSSSPISSPTKDKKQTGPITVRELERILMTNEEMGESEDDEANDDMSGNVPDGDEPSPAMVERTGPAPAPAPTQMPSIAISPSLSPTTSSPGPSPGPSLSPSEEVSDWFPPATAPGPDMEPADEVAPKTTQPPKSNDAKANMKVHQLHVIIGGMLLWLAL